MTGTGPDIPQKNANVQVFRITSRQQRCAFSVALEPVKPEITETTEAPGRLWRGQLPEARRVQQHERLLRAAGAVVVRVGYPATTADAISREAKMSKATFYAHFGNKEECFLAMLDVAWQRALGALVRGARDAGPTTTERQRGGLTGFLDQIAAEPVMARAVLVEGVNGGPRAVERRDAMIAAFAEVMFQETEQGALRDGGGARFVTVDDAVGVVGAVVELTARHLRSGQPKTITEVQQIVERILFGVLVDDVSGLR